MFREPMKLVQDDTKYMRLSDFSGGRNTTISPALLNVNESPTAECVSFDQKGTIYPSWGRIKRYGKPFTDRPITGLGEFRKTDGTTRLMIGAGDAVYYDSPNLPWTWEGDKFDNGTLDGMEKDGNKLKPIKRKFTFIGLEEVAGQMVSDSYSIDVYRLSVPVVLKAGAIVRKIGIPARGQSSSYTVSVILSRTFDLDGTLVRVNNVRLPASGNDVVEVDLNYEVTSSGTYWVMIYGGGIQLSLYWRRSNRELPQSCWHIIDSGWRTTTNNYCVFVKVRGIQDEASFEDGKLKVEAYNELTMSPGVDFRDQDALEPPTNGVPLQTFDLGIPPGFEEVSLPSRPSGTGYGCAFDPTGTYLAVAQNSSPYITIYKRDGDTFTKLDDPDTLPASTCYGCAFDPTGTYLAVGHVSGSRITIYKRDGDTFTKLPNPDTLPTGTGRGCAFDPTGTYLAVAHQSSPYITIYKRSGDTFTKLANPSTLPTGVGYGCAFDPTGTYLAVSHGTSPRITIYKRDGDTFTKLADPATLPLSTGWGCAFDPTGTYLAVAQNSSPYITIYKRDGDTFTKLDDPPTLPTGTGRGCVFDPTGTYLAVTHDGNPYITIYKRDSDTFTKVDNPSTLPTGDGQGCTFDPTGTYLAVAHSTSPYITIYKRVESSVVGDLYSDGRLVISGEGDMRDFSSPEESPFYNNTLVKSLVIHDGITHLGSYAFCECPNLKEIRNYCGEGQTLGTDVFLNSGANISDKKAYGIDTNTEFMAAMEDSGYKWNDLYSNQIHFELGFKITSLGNLQTLLDLNGVEGYTLVVNITPEGKIEVISSHEEVISDLEITIDTDYLLRVVRTPSIIQVFLNDELYGEIRDVNYVVTNDNPMYFARGVTGYIWGIRIIRDGVELIRADLAQNFNITCNGAWISPVVDVSNAKDFSTGYVSVFTESGSYLMQSRSADNENGSWSDWVPASDAGKLLHEPKPYVQLRIVSVGEALITSVTMYFDGKPTAILLKDGLTPNAMYCFRTFGDRVIIANGYDPLMAWDGESEAPVLVEGDPPSFQFIEVHQNRLWGWGGPMPSRLRYSDLLDADSWPALNFIDVSPDDGDHPTGLKTYGTYLLLPKSKRIAVLIGDQANNYSVTWLESSFGIQGMNAISSTDKYLSYVAQDGIRFTDMTSSVTAVERLLPDWEKLDKRLLYKAAQIYWGHTLLTALPGSDAVSGNTEVWMYDALRNAWTIRYDWKLSCFLRFIEYGEEVLLAGDSTTGQIYKIVPDPYNDGIPVQYKWKSKDLNFGEPERYKVWPVVFLQVEGEHEQRTLKVRFFVDGRETGGPNLTIPAGKGMIFTFRLVPPQYGAVYGQRLAISLEGSNGVHLITIGYTLRTFSVGV